MNQLLLASLVLASCMKVARAHALSGNAIKELFTLSGITSKIVGGTTVDKGRYEFLALTAGPQLCGATLIHSDILLTAGHCSTFFDDGVYIGGIQLSGTDGQFHAVDYVYSHEDYPGGAEPNDIAMVKLSSPSSIQPVALATAADSPSEGSTLTTMGWGKTSEEGTSLPSSLLETNLDVSEERKLRTVAFPL